MNKLSLVNFYTRICKSNITDDCYFDCQDLICSECIFYKTKGKRLDCQKRHYDWHKLYDHEFVFKEDAEISIKDLQSFKL